MKFFFPDSQDHVDPSFEFERETRSETRVRQRDDLYAHEIFDPPPFDGLLVSKAIVDGRGTAKYTLAQRRRLMFEGVRRFFRLENTKLETIGDCGAFSYRTEEVPPYSVEEVLDFYESCGFDYGFSVDHMIGAYQPEKSIGLPGLEVPEQWRFRQKITLELADQFLRTVKTQRCQVKPIGVAQGWSDRSYAESVEQLQEMGYEYIALGGIVPLKTFQILEVLKATAEIRHPKTKLHLLGVTRLEGIREFANYGVYSFDSTSPLMRGIKDSKNNYYTLSGTTYSSIAVPQIEGNNELRGRIRAGQVDQGSAIRLEQKSLDVLRRYDKGMATVDEVLEVLKEYGQTCHLPDRLDDARRTLGAKPWKSCACAICKDLGIHVVLKRGAERNRRRGLHNVYVTYELLQREINSTEQELNSNRRVLKHASV